MFLGEIGSFLISTFYCTSWPNVHFAPEKVQYPSIIKQTTTSERFCGFPPCQLAPPKLVGSNIYIRIYSRNNEIHINWPILWKFGYGFLWIWSSVYGSLLQLPFNCDMFFQSKDHQQEETKKYTCLSCHLENCTYNAHHMNHPWWSSHLDFNSMLRRRSRGWWHCHDLRFLCEGGRLSEATISSYNLRNTTIHIMLYNIAYMNMCFFS